MPRIKLNELVVLNDSPEATVFKVKDLQRQLAYVTFLKLAQDGRLIKADGGQVEISRLKSPTKHQLACHLNTFY